MKWAAPSLNIWHAHENRRHERGHAENFVPSGNKKDIQVYHCFGERAAEIIHIGQAIMEQKGGGNTIEYFVNTTFNYPTMAEAYRVAALNGLNRLF